MDQEPASVRIDPSEWLRQQRQRTTTLRVSAERASAELRDCTVTATSKDHAVTVTVSPGGMLLDLRFAATAQVFSLQQLAECVLRTYRSACSEGAELTLDIMSEVVGEDSPALQFLADALPPVEDDDGEVEYTRGSRTGATSRDDADGGR